MRLFAIICTLIALTTALTAQEAAENDKTYLEGWLQDALSDAGRDVRITGFAGALSSRATLEQMTISDENGVWLTLRDATLNWTRSALFSGHLDITELSAREIEITRLPGGQDSLSPDDAEATAFALPELPVSVDVEEIRAETILLGQAVLGEPATLSLLGRFTLEGGNGTALLDIRRTDRQDRLKLEGGFSNESRVLRLDLDFDEDKDGLVSRTLQIPGHPALRLQVQGEAPLSDYEARIALTSEGQRRFGGTARIAAAPEDDTHRAYLFSTALSGDVRPLFTPDLHPFFGEESQLELNGASRKDGGLDLEKLHLQTGATEIDGSLSVAPGGWPERFSLNGQIGGGSDTITLPLTGPETTLKEAVFSAGYNAAQGESWTIRADIRGFSRDGLQIRTAGLTGDGRITQAPDAGLAGRIAFDISGLAHDDAGLARAIGPAPAGALSFRWQPDAPLDITGLELQSGDVQLTGQASIDQLAEGLPVTGEASLRSGDFSRFAALAGRDDLAGSGQVTLSGSGTALSGAFDINLSARTEGLTAGVAQADPLLSPPTRLSLKARRDETGTTLDTLNIANTAIRAQATGHLNSQSGRLTLDGDITDIAQVEPRLSGPARIDTAINWNAAGDLTLEKLALSAVDAVLTATGTLRPDDPALPASGKLRLQANDLSRLSRLAGQPLQGRANLSVEGAGELAGTELDANFDLTGSGIRSGLAELDRLIAGDIAAAGSLALGNDLPDLRYLRLDTAGLKLNASGDGPGEPIAVALRLTDLGRVAPGFEGPAAARGTLTIRDRLARDAGLDLNATGPGGLVAKIAGQVADYGQSLALGITGNAPLGLANRFITPRSIEGPASFALRLEGAPGLAALSGRVEMQGARVSLPVLDYALTDLRGLISLENGSANVDINGSAGSGGAFGITGPIGLTAPFPATLAITLSNLVLADPGLYAVRLNGDLSVAGALTGGALIGGIVNLTQTELRVPSGSGTIIGALPDIRHIGEPAKVATTRRRAGMTGGNDTPMRPYPLDLTIRAPNRIFVRGRGLDAELGGQLKLSGTTANVQASGMFELIRGRLDILGKRLVLTEGLIDLRGALDPYLRFVAETEADDLIIRVILQGLASEPTVTFTSEPDLPEEEAVARLLFGQDLASMSAFQAAQLVSAVATLSGRYSGGLTGRVRDSLGLSDLDIATTDEGATQVRAGAYIADNVYSEVTVDSEGNQELNLNLDVGRFVTVKGRTNNTGNTGIGIFFEKDY